MQEDRLAGLFDHLVDRPELRLVERRAVHIGGKLNGIGAVAEHAFGLLHCRLGRIHRQQRRIADHAVAMFCRDFGETIVADLGHLRRLVRPPQPFHRGQAVRDHLGVVVELIDDAQPQIDIGERRNPAHALAEIFLSCRGFQECLVIALGEEMIVGIDIAHRILSSFQRHTR